jgi:hypothetical protein
LKSGVEKDFECAFGGSLTGCVGVKEENYLVRETVKQLGMPVG